jgi:hypothetical protein
MTRCLRLASLTQHVFDPRAGSRLRARRGASAHRAHFDHESTIWQTVPSVGAMLDISGRVDTAAGSAA